MRSSGREDRYIIQTVDLFPLGPPQTPLERPRGFRETTCLSWAGACYNMHCRFSHHHGFTIPRYIVHESSNNTMKRESAEVARRQFLRGTHPSKLGFMQQRQVKPCRLVKRRQELGRHKAWS